ncbi:MAG: beta-lactamase family protein [Anaerolineae bacterium]|nr:beta-lactamase family protein [Anaerolineae bacterium]
MSNDLMAHTDGVRELAAQRKFRRAMMSTLLILVLLIGTSCTQRSPDTFTEYLDGRIPRLMNQYDIPGASVAVVRDGDLVWSEAYGYADLEHERKMRVDAVYRAESISKSVTAWGVMRLVEQGRIDLDTPVQQYLDDWQLPDDTRQEVTIRRLLSQSAGMPLGPIGVAVEYAPQSAMPSLRDYLAQEARLVREPGSGFLYSNVGFNLLELLIEEVTGRDFAAYMADEVLTPLGMHSSSFAWKETLRPLIPMGYEQQGTPVPPYVYPASASGGLLASVEDIARFVSAEMRRPYDEDHAVLEHDSIRELHTPEVDVSDISGVVADSYGLGHFVENLPGGRRAVWHGGQGHGWMTHFLAVPESGDGVVILTNSERSWPFMAHVLTDWARWSGFGSVKMGRIIYATIGLRTLIGMGALFSLWQVYCLLRGLRSGNRGWAPLSRDSRNARLLQAALGIGVITALAWSAAQPYLMVVSVFPSTVGWAGGTFLVWAVTMILSALFAPERSCVRDRGNGLER